MPRHGAAFDRDELERTARDRTGLDDFGPVTARDRFAEYCEAFSVALDGI